MVAADWSFIDGEKTAVFQIDLTYLEYNTQKFMIDIWRKTF